MPKLPNQIIGSFIFRSEGDGCLTSKYHHADSIGGPFVEASKITTPITPNDVFVGTYDTSWIEDLNISVVARLEIIRSIRNRNLFQLFWRDPITNNLIFEGTAMLFDGLLVGAYWD